MGDKVPRKRLNGILKDVRQDDDKLRRIKAKAEFATLTVFFTETRSKSGETEDRHGSVLSNEVSTITTETTNSTGESAAESQAIEEELFVIVCRRGVNDRNYGQIFSCGGEIDWNETPEVAACREAFEESGIDVPPDQIQYFQTSNKRMAHFYVILDQCPEIAGAEPRHAWEILTEPNILGYPTTNSWAAIPVHVLASHFEEYPSSHSPFSKLFMEIYESFIMAGFISKKSY
jgi:ADP-ribose pyrophosphatase YjhB (NUDIX family)